MSVTSGIQQEPLETVTAGDPNQAHFEFGRNWASFLTKLDEQRIAAATSSVQKLLKCEGLSQKRFLDAGCGSGLFSLAAHRLGAAVTSFDYDENSVACAQHLKKTYGGAGPEWMITQGSLLDESFMQGLGAFDVVYCWGVAHHTGAMWRAIELLAPRVAAGGQVVIAIYNDEEYVSRAWKLVKSWYQRLPRWLRPLYVAVIGLYWPLKRLLTTMLACLVRLVSLRNPLVPIISWINEFRQNNRDQRGMDWWIDLKDWVGGWPFEVAKPEEIFRFFRDRDFVLEELITRCGHGCNEFVFRRTDHVD